MTYLASCQYVTNSNERVISFKDETIGLTLKFIELFEFLYKMANLNNFT
jgi:hypothetical protein